MADNRIDSQFSPSKRSLHHATDSSPKRSKLPVVDSLPVRSRIVAPADASDGEKPIPARKLTPRPILSQSFSRDRQTRAACWTTSSTEDTDCTSSAPGWSSGTCSFNHDTCTSDTSFFDSQLSDDDGDSDLFTTPIEEPCNADSAFSWESTAFQSLTSAAAPSSPNERLKNIWPDFPLSGLAEAPLAVRWEITRIAQHCDLTSSDCDIPYEPNCDLWKSQSTLRERFSVREKPLPRRSDEKAWQAALRDFRLQENAVVLSAALVPSNDKSGPPFHLRLSPLELHLSHRLERRFGADRFLSIYMLSDAAEEVLEWLVKTRHYFLGRLWQAFYMEKSQKAAKSTSNDVAPKTAQEKSQQVRVLFFATDGDHFRTCPEPDGLPPGEEALDLGNRKKMNLARFLSWAISMDNSENKKQPLAKLFSRIALSLTRCRATIILSKKQIRHRTNDMRSGGALSDGAVMNDGIGRMSQSLAKKIATHLGLDEYPCCFQGRFGSAKGVWICATGADQDGDWIETFPSQRKWKCNYNDPLHRTFEVHSWPRKPKPARLNKQFIPLLEHRARDQSAMRRRFAQLVANDIADDLDQLMSALGDTIDMREWLYRQGRDTSQDVVVHKTIPFLGGLPRWTEDEVALMLDAGFDHRKLKRLSDKCFELGQRAMERIKTKMHIRVPQSTNLLMVVDFDGLLAEDEVHIHFTCNYRAGDFCEMMLKDRDVLVARSPAHLPSDIRKVRAVFKPELHRLGNVVVFPIKGTRPLADFLSGGDYDGDMAWVCFDDEIVANFSNCDANQMRGLDLRQGSGPASIQGSGSRSIQGTASASSSSPNPASIQGLASASIQPPGSGSDLIKAGFIKQLKDSVWDIQQHERLTDDETCTQFILRAFRFTAQPSLLGICTKFKEKLCYWHDDVGSAQAVTLAHLLAHLVDQAKQGLVFTDADWLAMRRRLKLPSGLPDPDYTRDKPSMRPRHILDHLKFDVAHPRVDDACVKLSRCVNAHHAHDFDPELTALYNHYDDLAAADPAVAALMAGLKRELRELVDSWAAWRAGEESYAASISEMHEKWQAISPFVQQGASDQSSQDAKNKGIKNKPSHHARNKSAQENARNKSADEKRLEYTTPAAQSLVEPWIHDADLTRWGLLKASTTFSLFHRGFPDLAWRLAGRALCHLKALSRAPVVVSADMYRALRPNSRFIQRRRAAREDSLAGAEVGYEVGFWGGGDAVWGDGDAGASAGGGDWFAHDAGSSGYQGDWGDSDGEVPSDYYNFDPENFD